MQDTRNLRWWYVHTGFIEINVGDIAFEIFSSLKDKLYHKGKVFFIYFICNGVLDQEPYVKCEILAKNLCRDRNIDAFMICPSTNYVETSEWWKKKTCQTNKSIEKLVNNKLVFSQYHLWMDHDYINSQKPIYWWNAVQLKKLLTFSKGKKWYQPPFHCNAICITGHNINRSGKLVFSQ